MHPFNHYPMPINGNPEIPVSNQLLGFSFLVIAISLSPKICVSVSGSCTRCSRDERWVLFKVNIKVYWSLGIEIRLITIISGKSEPGRTSGPSANGITSHRFIF
jgi:hypothetical protein